MVLAKTISYEWAMKWFSCDFETGLITQNKSYHLTKVGKQVGTVNKQGYVILKIERQLYSAARVAWVLFHGSINETMQIDHINRIKRDNRISNLRLVNSSENCRNRSTYLFAKGFTQHKNGKLQVQVNGKYVGLCDTEIEAEDMRKEAMT